jgi:hypothetical protein
LGWEYSSGAECLTNIQEAPDWIPSTVKIKEKRKDYTQSVLKQVQMEKTKKDAVEQETRDGK